MRMTLKAMFVATLALILMQMAFRPVALFGKHDGNGAQDLKLQGVWNVTLRFPVCNAFCTCPGGVPNIPIPSLNTYLKDRSLLVALGGSLSIPSTTWRSGPCPGPRAPFSWLSPR